MPYLEPPAPKGIHRLLPGLESISTGLRKSPFADSRAAITAWAIVVPQSLAYATLAGVPSVHGLYTALGALALYALFGTCRDLNMGAESTVALMAAATVAPLVSAGGDPVELTAMVALLVGGWCVLGWVFRLGFVSEFLSRPILAGYVFGSGIIIVISQLEALIGLDVDTDLYTTDIGAVISNLGDADATSTVMGLVTIVLVMGLRRFVPAVPAPLVAVVLGIALVTVFDLDQEGVAVVGSIESGIPTPGLPDANFQQFTSLLLPTLGIALLAYPDSFLTAKSLSVAGNYDVDPNQEFLAVGASNVASGLLQGIPANGSQSRSFVQRDAGGSSNLVGLLCAVLVLVTLLFLTPLFENLPDAVLAGIVIVAGIGLFDLHDFRSLWRIRRSEFWLGVSTILAVLLLGMLGGIAFAIGLSMVTALARITRPRTAELGRVAGTDTYRDLEQRPEARHVEGLLIYRVDDELFFANAAFVCRDIRMRLSEAEPPASWLLIDAEGVSDVDTTAVDELAELLEDLEHSDVGASFARIRRPVLDMLERSGLLERIGEDNIYLEIDDGVRAFQEEQNRSSE